MTREELHQQVWSQPMRTLAKSMGISDVALAKRCKVAQVPLPPRGWWARKAAGKPVKVEPLPPLPMETFDYFPAYAEDSPPQEFPKVSLDEDVALPGPPTFRDLAVVTEEIRSAVKPLKIPKDLGAPHATVARLLRIDAKREPRPPVSAYFPDTHGPRFANPLQQRRLRILSAFLTELQRLGCRIDGNTHAGERFSIRVGWIWIYIFFGVEGGLSPSWFRGPRRGPGPADKPQLRFDIIEHDDRAPPKRSWVEDARPLEQQVTEIVTELLLYAEVEARRSATQTHRWRCEEHLRQSKAARIANEQAIADRAAAKAAAAAARMKHLTDGADDLERAGRIRRYVEAVTAANATLAEPVEHERLAKWRTWALAQADSIDPVVSGRFVAHLNDDTF